VSAAPAPSPAPPAPAAAMPAPSLVEEGRKPVNKKLYAVKDLCVGCRICEVMCSLKHNGTGNPYRARLKITLPQGNAYNFTPIICRHCKNPPPCMQACPVNAFYIDPNTEAAVIDSAKCISCMACVHACPFGAIQVGPDQREILKCDLCGGDPVCVKYCADRPENLLPHRPYPRTSVLRYDEPHKIAELTRQLHTSKV
jgi:Fe-S-cluster-containing hydrogenase component 2